MTYPDSVQFLYALGNEIKTAKLGLERIGKVLEALGRPHRAGRFVHVAGTNGKGSTCAMIAAGCQAAGWRTGLFTSPHLVEPTERIRVDGQPISREEFAAAFNLVHQTAEKLELDFYPTYFETVTAMAFVVFRGRKVDAAVLEVGLGGRLDATNVVQPDLAVITPVDFDHEAHLGKSLEAIAAEKAGILKPGVPAVLAPQRIEAAAVLEARAAEVGTRVVRPPAAGELELDERGSRFTADGQTVRCPLAGEHQVVNALTAIAALRELGLPPSIEQVRWPGRLERISESPELILDGAHNPAGARALGAYIDRFYRHRPVWLIYGAMRDKAVAEMAAILFPRAARVIVTAPRQARAVRPETIRDLAAHPDLEVAPDLAAALARARAAPPETAVFVAGSLFLVGEALAPAV